MSKAHCPVGCWIGTKGKRGSGRDSNCYEFFFHYNFWLSLIGILVLLLFFLLLKVEQIPAGFLASTGGLSYDFQVYWNGEHEKKNHQEMPLYWFSISWNKWTHRIFCLQFSHYVSWLLRKTCLFLTYPTEKLSEISFKNAAFKKCILMQPVH